MKYLLLLTLFMLPVALLQAQNQADSAFHYDRPFYTCENRWVMTPAAKNGDPHIFGYVYLDATAGFTLEVEGEVVIDENHQLVKIDKGPKQVLAKVRLGNQMVKFCPLSKEQVKELGLEEQPSWLKMYLIKSQELHDVAVGTTLNANGYCDIALPYLQSAYALNPDTNGAEFELAFAYNALGKWDNAIVILERAVKKKPSNGNLYKELGYAQMCKGKWQEALDTFQKGWTLNAYTDPGYKGEMAYHIAMIYKEKLKDMEQYRIWGTRAKQMVKRDSQVYQQLSDIRFRVDDSPGILLYDKWVPGASSRKSNDQVAYKENVGTVATSPVDGKNRVKTIPDKIGTFTDVRDGKTYKWVKIGGMTWMAENLNFFLPGGSRYYNDNEENGKKYGLLYSFNSLSQVCPKGWHIPSDKEWQALEIIAGMNQADTATIGWRSDVANDLLENGSTSFNVLFGGYGSTLQFQRLGEQAYFWTSSHLGIPVAFRAFSNKDSQICRSTMGIAHYLSVRCVKDE